MKTFKVSEIIRMFKNDGWFISKQKGSHRQFKHMLKKGKVTVNGKPSDDLWGDLLKSVEKQSGIKF